MKTFTQTGGARIGEGAFLAFNATWPFATLTIDEREIALRCLWMKWIFPKETIRYLTVHDGVFSTGMRIDHTNKSYTGFIVFWSFKMGTLLQELNTRGYTVENSSTNRNTRPRCARRRTLSVGQANSAMTTRIVISLLVAFLLAVFIDALSFHDSWGLARAVRNYSLNPDAKTLLELNHQRTIHGLERIMVVCILFVCISGFLIPIVLLVKRRTQDRNTKTE